MEALQGVTQDDRVIYTFNERVVIVRELEQDYLIEDLNTHKQYLVDKVYFRRRYIAETELIPMHQEVWNKLDQQARELHQLKKANSRLRGELRSLRKQYAKLKKDKKETQHYKNGKRGTFKNGG